MENKTVRIGWFKTGHHRFKYRSSQNGSLLLYIEKHNPVDPYTLLVKSKTGMVFGRIPVNLCRLILPVFT